jgi:hypothetical protein
LADSEELAAQRLRATRVQSWFRETNERIFTLREGAACGDYLCECGLRTCGEEIQLSLLEYLEVRSDPTHFVVAPGHVSSATERVVTRTEFYSVVEKLGDAAVLAARAPFRHE